MRKNAALIVVDVQNDFCTGGALAVPQGEEVVPVINKLLPLFGTVVSTQDWHPDNHCSFKDQGGLWPKHCVRGTQGAALHTDLSRFAKYWFFVFKGFAVSQEAYSGFDSAFPLAKALRDREIRDVYVCGLAFEYCVKETAIDAVGEGFRTYVILDACRGIDANWGDTDTAARAMRRARIKFVNSRSLITGRG